MVTVYKVIRQINYDNNGVKIKPVNTSATAISAAKVIYSTKRYSSAPEHLKCYGYHLLVFLDKENAVKWCRSICSCCSDNVCVIHIVYACDANNVLYILPPPYDDRRVPFGEDKAIGLPIAPSWPEGSVMAKEVKLKRRVWPIKHNIKKNIQSA